MSDYKANEVSLIILYSVVESEHRNCNTQSEAKDAFLERSDEKLQMRAQLSDAP